MTAARTILTNLRSMIMTQHHTPASPAIDPAGPAGTGPLSKLIAHAFAPMAACERLIPGQAARHAALASRRTLS